VDRRSQQPTGRPSRSASPMGRRIRGVSSTAVLLAACVLDATRTRRVYPTTALGAIGWRERLADIHHGQDVDQPLDRPLGRRPCRLLPAARLVLPRTTLLRIAYLAGFDDDDILDKTVQAPHPSMVGTFCHQYDGGPLPALYHRAVFLLANHSICHIPGPKTHPLVKRRHLVVRLGNRLLGLLALASNTTSSSVPKKTTDIYFPILGPTLEHYRTGPAHPPTNNPEPGDWRYRLARALSPHTMGP
jgi:hypothetical protein